jgi:hypothetical protein
MSCALAMRGPTLPKTASPWQPAGVLANLTKTAGFVRRPADYGFSSARTLAD